MQGIGVVNAFDDLFREVLPDERSERETDLAWRRLGLEAGMEVRLAPWRR
jgi:hypothetical protein